MPSPTEITVAQLSLLIGTPDTPTIVRRADTNQHQLTPESAGLLAASLGLSRMYRDDNAQLDAGMLIYDAFYRWARDATNENHNWPQTTKGN